MKKLLYTLTLLALLVPNITLAQTFKPATLYKGADRVAVYTKAEADNLFAKGYVLEQKLGFAVVSDYKTTLSSSINSTQTTIPVSSVQTRDGHTITMADLGSKAFLTIEAGLNKAENIVCTGISGSTWTGCTRGLAFYGTSTSSVSANQKTHNSGAQVIMSNTQYVYQQFVDNDTDQTIAGVKTFASIPKSTGTNVGTSTTELATIAYVNSVATSGAPNIETTVKGVAEASAPGEFGSTTASTGETGARLVPLNNYFAETSQGAIGFGYGVVSRDSDGKIDPSFIATSSDYVWAGSNTFSGQAKVSNTAGAASTTDVVNVNYINSLFSGIATTVVVANTDYLNSSGNPRLVYVTVQCAADTSSSDTTASMGVATTSYSTISYFQSAGVSGSASLTNASFTHTLYVPNGQYFKVVVTNQCSVLSSRWLSINPLN